MGVIMDNKGVLEKGIISVLGTWISNRFGLLLPALGLLIFFNDDRLYIRVAGS